MDDGLLKRLKDEIEGDLHPVRPIGGFWRRIAPVAGLWLLLAVAVLTVLGLRVDHQELGPLGTWLFPAIQLLAVAAVAAFLHQSTIPGSLPPQNATSGVVAAALVTHLFAVFGTQHIHFSSPPHPIAAAIVCFCFVLALGIPLLVAFVWLVRSGLFARAGQLGLLAGLGAGLAAEALWRLHCPYTSWHHIVFSHTLGALVIAGAGLLYLVRYRTRG